MKAPADIQKLQAVVYDMDHLAQAGFTQVRALAMLVLAHLETPDGYRHPENMAGALTAIWQIADNHAECISNRASDVGMPYLDESQKKRQEAYWTATKEGQK